MTKNTCRICGKPSDQLSRRKICPECQERRVLNVVCSLREKKGEEYLKWLDSYRRWLEKRYEEVAEELSAFIFLSNLRKKIQEKMKSSKGEESSD